MKQQFIKSIVFCNISNYLNKDFLMKKSSATLLFLLIGAMSDFAQKTITLEDIWKKGTFTAKSIPGFNFLKDGKHYTRLEREEAFPVVNQYDLTTGEKVKTIVHANELKGDLSFKKTFDSYTFSPNEEKILVATQTEAIYRHSEKAQFYVLNRDNMNFDRLYEKAPQRAAAFNPQADKVAFVSENNLYFKDLATGKVNQITFDGKENEVINGAMDWVYEEEFSLLTGFQWSPDGNKIAYLRFDERAVPQFTMEYYNNGLYPTPYTFKYPKVGQPNATVAVFIYDITTQQSKKVSISESPNDYYPRIKWTQDPNKLCLFHLNRLQNELTLFIADARSGDTYPMMKEVNKAYIEIHDNLIFLKDGKHFVWTTEQQGYNHIWLYELSGRPVQDLTPGDFDITELYGINETEGCLYYQAAAKNPMEREIYAVKLDGTDSKTLSIDAGFNTAQFSSTFDYFILNHSTINTAPTFGVYRKDGTLLRVLEKNTHIAPLQAAYQTTKAEFFKCNIANGTSLNGWMIKPAKMKKKKKYPVLMYVYGGPGSQQVLDQWKGANYWWFQLLAQKGYVVACVDNRGTGARGEEFKKITYKQLGKYETEDQIAAAQFLGTLPFVDASRIGIFGWSYGGFMASSCLFKGADIFKAAIAVAPVTNWKWYDSIYTERYMQTEAENAEGYKENSPVNFADKMKGNLLLVHGTADDNVHFQNSVELVNALITANKQFDTYYYPNRNHGIAGGNTRLHLYTKMTNFLLEKL
jgi:dipeptidyl-peptidase 4